MEKCNQHDHAIARLALIALSSAFTALLLVALAMWATGGWEQIERAQKQRADFAIKCLRQGGEQLQLRKASKSVLCIGRDGRILDSY